MCGIFGYVGKKQATPFLITGLRTLEYRGYDSAGIYVPEHGVIKAVGPINNLSQQLPDQVAGTSGIAHTRWATHGQPTETNAHPHQDESGTIWGVHNGIIENYQEIKSRLQASGITFQSETDSEVLIKLIGTKYVDCLQQAVTEALQEVEGAYALAVMHQDNPHEIVVARLGSPVVLGKNADGCFIASDPSALLGHTEEVVYLEDGEIAVLQPADFSVSDYYGELKQCVTTRLESDINAVKKEGYDHFMLKEIHEAPEVIKNTIRGRIMSEVGKVKLGGLEPVRKEILATSRLSIVGCGSAFIAGRVGKSLLENYAALSVDVELASEYRYKTNNHQADEVLLAVSQSGETADTMAAIKEAKSSGMLTLGLVNVVGSSIARETTAGVYNHAGPEVAVASTKAFMSELVVFVLLAVFLGREKDMTEETGKEIVAALETLPDVLETMLGDTSTIEQVAKKYAHFKSGIYIGRGMNSAIAAEGSLKLKEVSYIHAEAYAGGELKHGPIALLDEQFPVIAIAPQDALYKKMVSNIEEIKARQAPVLALISAGDTELTQIVDDVIPVPQVHEAVQPIVHALVLHLLAYYIGVEKGLNVDRPRNLAKSVTVE